MLYIPNHILYFLNGNVSSGFVHKSVIYTHYPLGIYQHSLITQFLYYYVNTCDYSALEETRNASEALVSLANFEEAIQKIKTPTDITPEEKLALA
jgi:hypothetical protein